MDPFDDLPDDGRFARPVGPWIVDKLRIVAAYDRGFGLVSQEAGRWYYLDGFAGSGVHAIQGSGRRVPGAPLIALRTDPEFRRCVLVEGNRVAADALRTRTAEYGDRAVVEHGSADSELLPLTFASVSRNHPCMCLFDTEGADLSWSTVSAIADFGRGQAHKVEQVIILPTDGGVLRDIARAERPADLADRDPVRFFGHDRWRRISEQRRRGRLSPDEARVLAVRLYAQGIRGLGYRTVLARPILRRGRPGAPVYYFLVATDDESAGERVRRCFETDLASGASLHTPPARAPMQHGRGGT
jgi:three-Cys-motif partner protein